MDCKLDTSKLNLLKIFAALLTFMVSAGSLQATNLITTTAATVTCSTVTGPGTAGVITVKPSPVLTLTHTIVVTFAAPTNGLVVTPASITLDKNTRQTA